MSITRRIIDSARTRLNTIAERVGPRDVAIEELERQLAARAEARAAAGEASRRGKSNPAARFAGAGAEARRERQRAAQARDKRVKAVRARREQDEQRKREEAFRAAKQQARRQARQARSRTDGARSTSSGGGGSARPRDAKQADLAKWYKVLDLPVGADFPAVKSAYRKLMRKYHPDLHGGSPQKQKAATELTKQLTQAYNELETHLKGGPNN